MRNFPAEYLYIDRDGNSWYKRFKQKKCACDVNEYLLGSEPVVLHPDLTIQNLLKLVSKNKAIKNICPFANEILEESKNSTELNLEGQLCFYWQDLQITDNIPIINYPKMEVCRIDNNEIKNLDFLGINNIMNLVIKVDNRLRIVDENYKFLYSMSIRPTLMQVVYGLFWELTFFGKPSERRSQLMQIKENLLKSIKAANIGC